MVLATLVACGVGLGLAVMTSEPRLEPDLKQIGVCAGTEWYLRRAAYDRDDGGSVVQPVSRPELEARADRLATLLETRMPSQQRIAAQHDAWYRAFDQADGLGDTSAVIKVADACEARLSR